MARVLAERVNVNFPKPLLDDLRRYVPRSQRSEIIARATARELRRIKLQALLNQLLREAAWRAADHPELADGPAIDRYVDQRRMGWSAPAPVKRETRRG